MTLDHAYAVSVSNEIGASKRSAGGHVNSIKSFSDGDIEALPAGIINLKPQTRPEFASEDRIEDE